MDINYAVIYTDKRGTHTEICYNLASAQAMANKIKRNRFADYIVIVQNVETVRDTRKAFDDNDCIGGTLSW